MTIIKKAVAYYRVSTAKQGASGLGLEAQREAVMRHLQAGVWELAGEFTDIESGTRKGNARPELAKAIATAKRVKAVLIIAKLDRLARDVAFVSRLMESGVEFLAADNASANKLTLHILAAVAEAEADAISKRTKEALAAARARGVVLGKPANLTAQAKLRGADAQRDLAVTAYANIARRVINLRATGASFRAIAAQLNAEGESTREGSPFTGETVRRIYLRGGAGR